MKIAILGTVYPYRGGLATFNERLARQFMQEGHEVHIYTFTLQYPSFLFPGKTQFSTERQPADLHITRTLNSCNPISWLRTGHLIKKACPDMLICCYWTSFMAPCMSTVERIVKRNGKTRCIALVHNLLPHEPSFIDKFFAPLFVRSTDGFVALSESVVTDISKYDRHNKPKTFSPHPIYDHYGSIHTKEEACLHLALDPHWQYMLFFGLVRAYKGLDLLLDAFALMHKELPELRLLVAGEFYEDEEKYKKKIADSGLTDKVVVHNEFIADSELQYWFSAADLIVQPYKSATQSGVTQVAFHFNKPMLVTNVGGLGEIVRHGKMGYAVEPDSCAIAEALTDFYQNNRAQSFTDFVVKEKDKYTWDKLTAKFVGLGTTIKE